VGQIGPVKPARIKPNSGVSQTYSTQEFSSLPTPTDDGNYIDRQDSSSDVIADIIINSDSWSKFIDDINVIESTSYYNN
jgi:hypothetical protein